MKVNKYDGGKHNAQTLRGFLMRKRQKFKSKRDKKCANVN